MAYTWNLKELAQFFQVSIYAHPQYPCHPLQLTTTLFLCSKIIFNNKTVPLFFGIQFSDRAGNPYSARKQIQLRDIDPGSTLKPHASRISWFEHANTLKRTFLRFFILLVAFNTMVAGSKVVFFSDRLQHFYEEHWNRVTSSKLPR